MVTLRKYPKRVQQRPRRRCRLVTSYGSTLSSLVARTVLRRLRHPDGLSASGRPSRNWRCGQGRLRGDRSLEVGGQPINLDALSVRLRPMHVAVPLNDAGTGFKEDGKGAKAACVGMFGTSSDLAMQGWELRLFSVEDSEIKPGQKNHGLEIRSRFIQSRGLDPFRRSSTGTVRNAQGNFILRRGVYSARLIARGKGGLVGLSRPVYFRSVSSAARFPNRTG